MKKCLVNFAEVISLKNLAEAWQEFTCGKRNKRDVQEFSLRLGDHLIDLHEDLEIGTYRHAGYREFKVNDPKPRTIHKASVRDRLLHHAVHRQLYPYFAKRFIADSFSCQEEKGTHRALDRFRIFARKVSRNNTRTCWVLKCDIRKFFASIDRRVLMQTLKRSITDRRLLCLLENIIESFEPVSRVGLPLGNLTSQLFANVYMNRFDHFVKEDLKVKQYIRYSDDFVLMSENRIELEKHLETMTNFLERELKLDMHPDKVFLQTLASGVDFLGWVHFSHHRVLRAKTRQRMMKRISTNPTEETISSYLGLLKHGDTVELREQVMNLFWLTGSFPEKSADINAHFSSPTQELPVLDMFSDFI